MGPLLQDLVIVAGLGVVVAILLGRLRLPTLTGFLVAGSLAGPHALSLVSEHEGIEVLAEVGVVLLLFTVGLELSLARLRQILKPLLIGGSIQVGLTLVVVAAVALVFGRPMRDAILLGFVFALSSTAIVLRLLGERRELDAPHGRFIVGVLIFQDLCVVPMVLTVPLLAPSVEVSPAELGWAMGKALIAVVIVLAAARWIVPRALSWVAAAHSRELFLLSVLTLCIGTAWLTSLAGLSLALGAFLGGISVADTTFRHRAIGELLPLRDVFVSVFFISLGMLLDPRVFVTAGLEVLVLFAGFVLLKGVIATLAAIAMRFPPRAAWLAGVGLAQFGEFGFVLLGLAQENGLIDPHERSVVMAAGILSMSMTPLLIRWAPHLTAGERLLAPLSRFLTPSGIETYPEAEKMRDHTVIAGYGVAGQLMARALRASELPHVALELNADTVREAHARGERVYYGDATSSEALEHAGVEHARVVAIVINDPSAVPRVLEAVRRCGTKARVFVRTHYLALRDELLALGAHETIVEEVESGIEMLAAALRQLGVPRNVIERRIAEARERTLASARKMEIAGVKLDRQGPLRRLSIDSVLLTEGAPAVGRTLVELDLSGATGALCIAIERRGELAQHRLARMTLADGDVLHLAGTEPALAQAAALLTASDAPEAS